MEKEKQFKVLLKILRTDREIKLLESVPWVLVLYG